MFCLRNSKCLKDEDFEKQKKAEGKEKMTSPLNTIHRHKPSHHHKYYRHTLPANSVHLSDVNGNHLKPNVRHFTNINQSLHVKLVTNPPNQHVKNYSYRAVSLRNPRSANSYKRENEERTTWSVAKSVPVKNGSIAKIHDIKFAKSNDTASNPVKAVETETESLSEAQKRALEQLDDALNGFHNDNDDDEAPIIVADILPYGTYDKSETNEAFDTSDHDSPGDHNRSRSSSLSLKSENSMTGIISKRKSIKNGTKSDRRPTSVSFQLPEGHVDKPYAPMAPNHRPPPELPLATICVSDARGKVWYSGASDVYVDDTPRVNFKSNSFKGSFKNLFSNTNKYSGYTSADFNGYNLNGKIGAAPKIRETIDSFESLNTTTIKRDEQAKRKGNITRRSTTKY